MLTSPEVGQTMLADGRRRSGATSCTCKAAALLRAQRDAADARCIGRLLFEARAWVALVAAECRRGSARCG